MGFVVNILHADPATTTRDVRVSSVEELGRLLVDTWEAEGRPSIRPMAMGHDDRGVAIMARLVQSYTGGPLALRFGRGSGAGVEWQEQPIA